MQQQKNALFVESLAAFFILLSHSGVGQGFARLLAPAVPIIEIVVSLLLLFPRTRPAGLLASFSLMTLFSFYVGGMLLFSNNLPCSCGGVITEMGWKAHLIFNVIAALLAWVGWRSTLNKNGQSVDTSFYSSKQGPLKT